MLEVTVVTAHRYFFFFLAKQDKLAVTLHILTINSAKEQLRKTMIRLIQGVAVLHSLSRDGYRYRKPHCWQGGNISQATRHTLNGKGCSMFQNKIFFVTFVTIGLMKLLGCRSMLFKLYKKKIIYQ